MKNNIKIGITIGDANGIGPEVIIKTFLEHKEIRNTTLIIYSSVEIIQYYIELLKFKLTVNIINSIDYAIMGEFNVFPISNNFKITPGLPSKESGQLAYQALYKASEDVCIKKIDAIVTGPIDKNTIQNAKFSFGQTEFSPILLIKTTHLC